MIVLLCHRFRALAFFFTVFFLLGLPDATLLGQANASEPELVYYSTNEFEITEFDRKMYLRDAPRSTEEDVGSRARNLQALSDLYAMEILMSDASVSGLLSEAERDWIARYAVQLAALKLYMRSEVDRRLEITDWDSEAMEAYQATPESYTQGESVSIRTLLIRSDERTEEEALRLGDELLAQARQPGADFEKLVRANSEDEVGRAKGGLMENVERGQTVKPFEAAAFALRVKGEYSDPVVSRFGVHLIQLLEYQEPRVKPFEEVRQQIIDELKPSRAAQYRMGIHAEARARKPVGFIEHTEALDALMLRTSDGKLGLGE